MTEKCGKSTERDVSHGAGIEGSQNPVNACKRRVTTKTSSECRKQAIRSVLTTKCIVILAAASKLIDPPSRMHVLPGSVGSRTQLGQKTHRYDKNVDRKPWCWTIHVY